MSQQDLDPVKMENFFRSAGMELIDFQIQDEMHISASSLDGDAGTFSALERAQGR